MVGSVMEGDIVYWAFATHRENCIHDALQRFVVAPCAERRGAAEGINEGRELFIARWFSNDNFIMEGVGFDHVHAKCAYDPHQHVLLPAEPPTNSPHEAAALPKTHQVLPD